MNMPELISVINHGPVVAHTNYFDTERAQEGFVFASWNAGALRLLVPDAHRGAVNEMLTAKNVVVTRGRLDGTDAYEVLFDDGTESPFVLMVDARQSDRIVGQESHGKPLAVHVYTREESVGTWQGRFRLARLPCLKPMAWLPPVKPRRRQS